MNDESQRQRLPQQRTPGATVKATVDGQDQNVKGPNTCETLGGFIKIAIGEKISGTATDGIGKKARRFEMDVTCPQTISGSTVPRPWGIRLRSS